MQYAFKALHSLTYVTIICKLVNPNRYNKLKQLTFKKFNALNFANYDKMSAKWGK